MNKKVKLVLQLFESEFLTLFIYILLHEGGHMIVMLFAGATITDFSIIGAHVSAVGGNYTNYSDMWLNANGAFLPLLVSYVYILFYKKSSENDFYRLFSWLVCLMPVGSLIAWVVIPFAYMSGTAPVNDDVTKFLYNFSIDHHPLIVSAAAILLIGIGVFLIIKKKVLRNFFEVVKKSKQLA